MANSGGKHADFSDDVTDDGADRPWHTLDEKSSKKAKSGSNKGGSFLRESAIIIGSVLVVMFVLTTFIGRQYVIPSESMESTLIGCDGCSNDRILTDKLAYRFGEPKPGDVVVFKVPDGWDDSWMSSRSSNAVIHRLQDVLSMFGFAPPDENDYVKRVIAVGGQTVECRNADGVGVKVNGKVLNEPYVDKALQKRNFDQQIASDAGTDDNQLNSCLGPDFGPVTIPADNVWVMGDNRTRSADSRYHMAVNPQSGVPEYKAGGYVPVSNIRGKVRTVIFPFSRLGGVGSINPQQ